MTTDEYEKLPADEKEHFAECAKCGEIFDRRSLDEVLFHTEHKHHRHAYSNRNGSITNARIEAADGVFANTSGGAPFAATKFDTEAGAWSVPIPTS
jgi:hypothetical protein